MRRRQTGSITAFLSLLLLVILSLLIAGLHSAASACTRVVLASSAEQAMFSAFAQYDKALYDRYGLLFLNCGYGTGHPHMEKVLRGMEQDAGAICSPQQNNPLGGTLLLRMQIDRGASALTGYVLATDQQGGAFARQVCEVMQKEAGAAAVRAVMDRVQQGGQEAQQQEAAGGAWQSADSEAVYEADKAQGLTVDEEQAQPIAPSENPLPRMQSLRSQGLLALVLPRGSALSGKSIVLSDTVSHRQLAAGAAMAPTAWKGGDAKLLLQEFLAENYPCFTAPEEGCPLAYEVEYGVGGKASDRANLEAVVGRLLALREAANLLYLATSPARRAETNAMAASIAALILLPALTPVIAGLLRAAWAFGEAVVDVRDLLGGGRVPVVVTDADWKLALTDLAHLSASAGGSTGGGARSGGRGLTYGEYLRVLLLEKSEAKLTAALMDLTELNVRAEDGRASFRLDCCVDAARVDLAVATRNGTLHAERSYGYDIVN